MTNADLGAEEMALIRQALWLAADTRILDIAQTMHLNTADASEFRARCWNLYEAMDGEVPGPPLNDGSGTP